MAIDIPDDGQSIKLAYATQLQANFKTMYDNSLVSGLDDSAARFAEGIAKLRAARDRASSIVAPSGSTPSVASSKVFSMTDDNQFGQALDSFEQSVQGMGGIVGLGGRLALPATTNVCTTWHNLKPSVVKIIAFLNSTGSLIPSAKRIASMLTVLENMLDAVCP